MIEFYADPETGREYVREWIRCAGDDREHRRPDRHAPEASEAYPAGAGEALGRGAGRHQPDRARLGQPDGGDLGENRTGAWRSPRVRRQEEKGRRRLGPAPAQL